MVRRSRCSVAGQQTGKRIRPRTGSADETGTPHHSRAGTIRHSRREARYVCAGRVPNAHAFIPDPSAYLVSASASRASCSSCSRPRRSRSCMRASASWPDISRRGRSPDSVSTASRNPPPSRCFTSSITSPPLAQPRQNHSVFLGRNREAIRATTNRAWPDKIAPDALKTMSAPCDLVSIGTLGRCRRLSLP